MLDLPESFFRSRDPPEDGGDIVATGAFVHARVRLLGDLRARRGNIRLIIGDRGIGKSTCIEYLRTELTKAAGAARVHQFDAGLHLLDYLAGEPDDALRQFFRQITHLMTDGRTNDVKALIDRLPGAEHNHFLFVDNLDRLHRSAKDLDFINYFFKIADPFFKALEKKVVVVVTAAPEWGPFLSKEDLSYLNYRNALDLKGVSLEELHQLIEARLDTIGKSSASYFGPDFLKALHLACRKSPRTAFQYLELFRNPRYSFSLPLGLAEFQAVLPDKLADGALETLRVIAGDDPQVSWGVSQLHRFFDELERAGLEDHKGIEALIKAYNRHEFDHKLVPSEQAWLRVCHANDEGQYRLNDQVRGAISSWAKQTGMPKETLLSVYAAAPFTATTTDVDQFADEYLESLRSNLQACRDFEASRALYGEIKAKPAADFHRKTLVMRCWRMNERLIESVLEGISPLDYGLRTRLTGADSFGRSAKDLMALLDDVFVHMGIHNPHRAELVHLLEQATDALENPTVIPHWEDYQLVQSRESALKTYESLLRLLKPKKVRMAYEKDNDLVAAMLQKRESGELECKSSLYFDYERHKKNEELGLEVMRAIAGYANASGGKVVVGISPSYQVLGLIPDYTILKGGRDEFEREVTSLIQKHLGIHKLATLVSFEFRSVLLQQICEIGVKRAPSVVMLRDLKGVATCHVRFGNSTRKLDAAELEEYRRARDLEVET